jgi:peptidoglycan/LPS O-acetylase OafA/YrhL
MGVNVVRADKATPRLAFLDALRGLAATITVLYHVAYVGGVHVSPGLSRFVKFGGSGVMLFFVVSCYSLFFTMPGRLKQARPVFSFYTHRFFRIAPLFYVWIMIQCVLRRELYGLDTSPAAIFENVFLVFNLIPGRQTGIVMASWTIGVEILFYAIFPLIYFKTKNLINAMSLTVGTMLIYLVMLFLLPRLPISQATAASYESWLFVKDLPVFAFGAICFFIVRDRLVAHGEGRDRAMGLLLVLIATYLTLAYGAHWIGADIFGGHPYIWPAICYSFLLVGLSLNPLKLLVNRFTRFLGTVSYSLYLAHAPIILILRPVYVRVMGTFAAPLDYVVCALITFAAALPLAYLTYRLVELPGIRLGKAFYARIVREKAIPPVDATLLEHELASPLGEQDLLGDTTEVKGG